MIDTSTDSHIHSLSLNKQINSPSSVTWNKKGNCEKADQFKKLYLDAIHSKSDICKRLNISSSSYYRFASQLNIPKYNVGLLDIRDFSQDQNRRLEKNPSWLFEFDIARAIGMNRGVRLEFKFVKSKHLTSSLTKGKIDFAITSFCATPERRKNMDFSIPYMRSGYAGGQLYKVVDQNNNNSRLEGRKVLGVLKEHVHEEYAISKLNGDYEIRSYKSLTSLKESVTKGNLHFVFSHPDSINFENLDDSLSPFGEFIPFPWDTCIATQKGHPFLSEINRAIEELNSRHIISQLEQSIH